MIQAEQIIGVGKFHLIRSILNLGSYFIAPYWVNGAEHLEGLKQTCETRLSCFFCPPV